MSVSFFRRPYPSANCVLLRGPRPVLVDTGFGADTEELLRWLNTQGVAPERLLVVNTHSHCDHAGGNHMLQARFGLSVAADPGEALIEAVILALCATHPALVGGVEARLERLDPADPGRAALVHDLLAGEISAAGRAALDAVMADPHVRSAPGVAHPAASDDAARQMLLNAFDRIEARRASREEIARAEAEMEGMVDEGLTWRVTQSARARQQADHPDLGGDSGVVGDQRSLADQFAAARAEAEALMKRRRR